MPAEVTRCCFPRAEVVNDCETPDVNARDLLVCSARGEYALNHWVTSPYHHKPFCYLKLWVQISKLLQKSPVTDVA